MSELLAFPYGRNDDQVDATSQALDYLTARAARAGLLVRRNITRRNVERRDVQDRESANADDEGKPARGFDGPPSLG